MRLKGAIIAGLGMANHEVLSESTGLVRLENPGLMGVPDFEFSYSLEDVATFHADHLLKCKLKSDQEFRVLGMSMGGMILSILATQYRHVFPERTKFTFLVTSPNSSTLPALPDKTVEKWFAVRPGDVAGFESILKPFFSEHFWKSHSSKVKEYAAYRANGKNLQSSKSFIRQMTALKKFNGESYFRNLNPLECTFVGGGQDYVLGPPHNKLLKSLCPAATHIELNGVGHMINIETPEWIREWAGC